MCVDYTDLNKSWKKDPFELPWIDQVVDSADSCNSGYHQIPRKIEDQIKTSCITPFGAFCLQLCLSNSKVRVQQTSGVYNGVYTQIGCNTEAYVDDVVIKTQKEEWLISNLTETFDNLSKFKVKLNPKKCMFGVPLRKLLKYMVSRHGIDPNPEKVLAITKMKLPESVHDVQKLMGCMAALSRFILWLSIRGLPIFKLPKK
jgi:hypothetical protein